MGLLDLDAFFASVEQLDHPEWRGLPLIVGGDADERGVVSTCSYEARRYGVRSAMPSAQARRLCPDAVWVKGRHDRYREVSDQVMRLILDETPYVEQVSVDEAYFDVTPGRFSNEDPVAVCSRISARVSELGLTCSIGLSSCKTVSKVASERNKPNGTTVVYPGSEESFLAPLPVRALPGIGPACAAQLEKLGLRTLGDLARADEGLLKGLGAAGPRMALRARGVDDSAVCEFCSEREVKSVSSEHTFPRDLTSADDILAGLQLVCSETARRLRAKGLKGRTVTVKCCQEFGRTRTARTTLERRLDDGHDIAEVARGLLGQLWREGERVRLLGVGVSNWEEVAWTPSLFEDVEGAERERGQRAALASTADALRRKYGSQAAMSGSELRLRRDGTV